MKDEIIKRLDERIQALEKQLEDRLDVHDKHLKEISNEMKKSVKFLIDEFNAAMIPECCKNCINRKQATNNCELRRRYNK